MRGVKVALTLKESFETGKVIPLKNIRDGKISEKSFVVSFSSILDGTADNIYRNPEEFFKLTHMTNDIKGIFKDVLDRLAKGEARPVLVIDTTFGGGKTHTLVALYHLFKNSEIALQNLQIQEVLKQIDLNKIPEIAIVTIDGRNLGAGSELKAKTIWGEIGLQLGCYDIIEEYDQKMRRPTIGIIKKMFNSVNKPVFILIDELVNYLKDAKAEIVGEQNLAEITVDFLQNLNDAVASMLNTMLILTLPGNELAFREESELMEEFKKSVRSISGREGAFAVPLTKDDVYKIVKNRLFEHVDDKIGKQVAEDMQKFYSQNSNYLSEEVQSSEYFKKLENSYPFHPLVVDILYERVATISEFNKTRGVLRLLSHVLRQTYQNRDIITQDLIISPGLIDLLDSSIFNELTNKIDRGAYQSIIRTDIVNLDRNARAQILDALLTIGPNVRVASAMYIYTLIGANTEYSKGANIKDIALAVSVPKFIRPGDVEEYINKLDSIDGLLYLKQKAGKWYFTVDISVKKLIYDAKQKISKIQKKKEIRSRLNKILRTDIFDVFVWDTEVRNPAKPSLVVTDYDYYSSIEGGTATQSLKDIIQKEGQNFREKQNLIYLLVAKKERIAKMEDSIALNLAIKEVKTSPDSKEELKAYMKRLEEYEKESNSNAHGAIELCYSLVFYPKGNGLKYIPIQNGFEGAKNLPEKVFLALKKAAKIFDKMDPTFIASRVLCERELLFSELYEKFEKNPTLPLPSKKQVVIDSVNQGVDEGLFGVYKDSILEEKINIYNFDKIVKNFFYKSEVIGGVRPAYLILPKDVAQKIENEMNELVKTTKQCPSCNKRNTFDAVECVHCGTPFERICPKCGEKNLLDAVECCKCGELISAEYQTCPKCGEKNLLDAVECRKCGELIAKDYLTCPNPKCGEKNPLDAQKCTKCGYQLKEQKETVRSFDEFIQLVESDNYTLKKVSFSLSETKSLKSIQFRLSTLTTGYQYELEASVKGENINLNLNKTKKVDINELMDIIERLANLVQLEVTTVLTIDYDEGINADLVIDTFKAYQNFEDDVKVKADLFTGGNIFNR